MKVENKTHISVVIPAYKCETCIEELYSRLVSVLSKLKKEYQIIFVNDCSPSEDWSIISKLAEEDQKVVGINLSKNFGQHSAITAGLEHASGDWVVVMDCDLQDKPEEIERLYNKALEGYDIVYAKRENRKDSFTKKLTSKLFYKVLSYLTGVEHDETVANFGIYCKNAIKAELKFQESLRYFPVLIRWVGFKSTSIHVEHSANSERNSSYSYMKLINLAFNVMLATSNKPLKLVTALGIFISFSSFSYAVYLFLKTLTGEYSIAGWPSLIVSIWFLSGMIIFTLGVLGLYVGKTFDEVKKKPHYIIKEYRNYNQS